MLTERMWYSNKLGWIHLVGYMVGTAMVVVGFDYLGISGLVRRAEIFPLTPVYVIGELVASAGAVIADVATLLWLGNLVITLLKGRTTRLEGLSVGEVISTVAMQLEVPKEITADIGKIGERLNLVKVFTRK
jgi:cytochrome c oxidase subunit 1/terminal oxidase heme-binding subunit I